MKLVMTLLVRDEADIVDDQIAFHLAAGVDFVIAADNESTDGTTEILESYARNGFLHRIRVDDPFSQVEEVTKMARLAATDFAADWVVNCDADEFWWTRGGRLKEVLDAIPRRYGSVRGMWRNFVPRPDGPEWFAERMIIRSQQPRPGVHPLNPHFKTIHRASPFIEVGGGNHDVHGPGTNPLPGWYPIDILHFPIRSLDQFERKFLRWWEITAVNGEASNPYYNLIRDAHADGRIAEMYEPFVVADDELRPGLAEGALVEDTRLRDALRELRAGADSLEPSSFPADGGYLVELGYLESHGPVARAEKSVEDLEERLASVERAIQHRLR